MLPIKGRYLSSSALVIGAMLPDLPLFVPVPFAVDASHTLLGAVTWNMLAGFVLFVLWHGFLARPADWFAPSQIRRRLSPAQQPGLRRRLDTPAKTAGVIASLLIGQATHFFFDQFTHAGTLVTSNVAAFNADVLGMPVYFLAQLVLSAVGLAVLGLWAVRWYQTAHTYPLKRQPSRLGKIAARGTVLGASAAALVAAGWAASGAGATSMLVQALIASIAALGATSILVAGVWHLRNS